MQPWTEELPKRLFSGSVLNGKLPIVGMGLEGPYPLERFFCRPTIILTAA